MEGEEEGKGGGGEGSEIGASKSGLDMLKSGRRVSSVVEHSSANPKVPGSIPDPVSYQGHGL